MQLKELEVHQGVTVAAELLTTGRPLEVQHFGYALLQQLVSISIA